jgi:hypothetical protein
VPPHKQGFMGVFERNICSEGDRGEAGETLNETVVRIREGANIIYSNVCRKHLMPVKAARWGEDREGKFHGVAEEKAGYQLIGGGTTAAVTCEHGTCTHGIIYALSEHVRSVENPCDIIACEMSVLRCHNAVKHSIRLQIDINGHVSNDWSRCAVLKGCDNMSWWRQPVMFCYERAVNVNRLQISLIGYKRAYSRLVSNAILCGNTVSGTLIYE